MLARVGLTQTAQYSAVVRQQPVNAQRAPLVRLDLGVLVRIVPEYLVAAEVDQ